MAYRQSQVAAVSVLSAGEIVTL